VKNALLKLAEHGQSYWMDDLSREMLESGDLEGRVREEGLRGITTNPTILHKAVSGGGAAYDEQIRGAVDAGRTGAEILDELMVTDVQGACDVLRPVYDETEGTDGFVSLEVSPHLARDTAASVAAARRFVEAVKRPNLFIKIPGTAEGLPAIEQLLYEGINVNITLLFSLPRYEEVQEAYLRGLERRTREGKSVDRIRSVASFFLSRIDVLVDELLRHRVRPDGGSAFEPHPKTLLGRTAIASAKLAYRRFRRTMGSDRWRVLAEKGAHPQRLLWASTSTKDPAYPDVMYVEPLIGAETVTTMPRQTIAAFADHGRVRQTVTKDIREAFRVMREMKVLGIDLRQVTRQLEDEGIQKFVDPYDALVRDLDAAVERRREAGDVEGLENVALRLRRDSIEMTTAAGSGHPTSCLSAAEIMAALFFREMRWDPGDPRARNVDAFVLSKGHAAPVLWAALREAGAIDEDLKTLRRIGSTLEGHPTPRSPWIRVATGSLGQGLSAANGMALANRLDGIDARVFCLLGDGECSEGSVWEAAQFASLNDLSRVVAIVDVNGHGQSHPAPYDHDSRVFAERFRSFGLKTVEIDGHDLPEVLAALRSTRDEGPWAIIARTVKGKGVSFVENQTGWHGKALDEDEMRRAFDELGEPGAVPKVVPLRMDGTAPAPREGRVHVRPDYQRGDEVATRDGYGAALKKLGEQAPDVVALDGDVMDSTRASSFREAFPDRFFESYIAEQNMVGTALGLAACDKTPFVATFAAFLTRAADFIRMAGHTGPRHLVFCGSHAGVSIGEDGPSQMGLEDLALFRAIHGSTVLYPCDAVSAEHLTAEAANTEGVVYLRTTRPKTPVIYRSDEDFEVGGSKTLRASSEDQATIVAAGITVHEALAAHDQLAGEGIAVRVMDAYSVKPLDEVSLVRGARETGAVIVVEDHWAEGGLGEAVAAVVSPHATVRRLAVTVEPRSGSREELLELVGISRGDIARAVKEVIAVGQEVPAESIPAR
jgi:transketolase